MDNEHIHVRQRLCVLVFHAEIPHLHNGGIASVQIAGVERLRDRRLLQVGIGVSGVFDKLDELQEKYTAGVQNVDVLMCMSSPGSATRRCAI